MTAARFARLSRNSRIAPARILLRRPPGSGAVPVIPESASRSRPDLRRGAGALPEIPESRIPEIPESRIPEIPESRIPGFPESRIPESRNPRRPVSRNPRNRSRIPAPPNPAVDRSGRHIHLSFHPRPAGAEA